MATIDRPNKDVLSKAIDIFRDAMRPFLIRCLKRVPGATVEVAIKRSLSPHHADNFERESQRSNDVASVIDVNHFPHLIQKNWRDAFSIEFGGDKSIQNVLWLISYARNEVAHPGVQDLEEDFTRAHLFHISTVLGAINAVESKRAVDGIMAELAAPPAPVAIAKRAATEKLSESGPEQTKRQPRVASNLKPWREVIRPNQDVAQGNYRQAEFAADLQQVYDGRADSTQYGNPVSFFNHTYITPGIRMLLVNTLKRLAGMGGDPVIQTKTGFGGGKTHSLIALFHLVRNPDALLNFRTDGGSRVSSEIRAIIDEAGYDGDPADLGQVAVLDGTFLAPTDTNETQAGDPLNTLWGVMAYQLGGQEAYEIIGEAARRGTAPGGSQLDALFRSVGPCVILIDELVAYVRNAGAAQDNIYTFVQALTQSVRRSSNVAVVLTLPQSSVEAGGEAGIEALGRLDRLLGRIEAVWEPLAVSETFEVVRRRLFGELTSEASKDEACEAFARMYSRNRSDYPQGVSEQNYLARLKECYPIHPEIFDRLYSDWSSIPGFQRTRGVLRMLATCVSRLYLNRDPSPLIMPADLPLDDAALANEFLNLLSGEWRPVMSEVDSDNSRTDNIDKEHQRFAEVGGAARRIARTVFLGSASSGAIRGIDSRQVRLGVVQPGQGVSTYNEALSRLTGSLYYLYHTDNRYFFHAEENLNKVASDRQNALPESTVDNHIVTMLDEARNRRQDVLLYDGDTSRVADDDFVKLIVLPPGLCLRSRSSESDEATPAAQEILRQRGDFSRFRPNTLLFLTAKRDEIRTLRTEVRKFLAWFSIVNGDTRISSLSGNRLRQTRAAVNNADKNVRIALVRAYRWAMAPGQRDPQKAEYRLSQAQTNAQDSGEIFRAAFDKFLEDEALVDSISPAALTSMLEQYIWKEKDGDEHLSIDMLWDLLTRNVYMHRLRDRSVLDTCVRKGVEEGEWGYAAGRDGDRYDGLRYGEPMTDSGSMMLDRAPGFLVRREAAMRQKEEEKPAAPLPDKLPGYVVGPQPEDPIDDPPDPPVGYVGPRQINVRKTTGPDISLDDINQLSQEIIRNLSDDGGEVSVEIVISASKVEGFSESITRAVRANSEQLKLEFTETH